MSVCSPCSSLIIIELRKQIIKATLKTLCEHKVEQMEIWPRFYWLEEEYRFTIA